MLQINVQNKICGIIVMLWQCSTDYTAAWRWRRKERQPSPTLWHQPLCILAPCTHGLDGDGIEVEPCSEARVLEPLTSFSCFSSCPHRQRCLGYVRWGQCVRHVKSHTACLPRDYGIRVAPSGRFPSPRIRLCGSRSAVTSALRKERAMTSFTRRCLVWRPALFRHASHNHHLHKLSVSFSTRWQPSSAADIIQNIDVVQTTLVTHCCIIPHNSPYLMVDD